MLFVAYEAMTRVQGLLCDLLNPSHQTVSIVLYPMNSHTEPKTGELPKDIADRLLVTWSYTDLVIVYVENTPIAWYDETMGYWVIPSNQLPTKTQAIKDDVMGRLLTAYGIVLTTDWVAMGADQNPD